MRVARAGRASGARWHCDSAVAPGAAAVRVTFAASRPPATSRDVSGLVGQNLVQLAHAAGVELEGACECSLACSTCHVILEPRVYAALDPPGEEEEDLLDLAFGLTATCGGGGSGATRAAPCTRCLTRSARPSCSSRLGCQVRLTAAMDGAKVQLPSATRNFYVDGARATQ